MSERRPMRTVTLLLAPGCHLCEQAMLLLHSVQADVPFELIECDITTEHALNRSYFDRVPVVMLDGEELFEYFVDEAELRERLGERRGEGTRIL
jgi:glutaredoxin